MSDSNVCLPECGENIENFWNDRVDWREDAKWTVYLHILPKEVSGYEWNKYYVGITGRKPEVRWGNGHFYKNNQYFTRAIEKYGWDNFKHDIVAEHLTQDEAEFFETNLILTLQSNRYEYGYNIRGGGSVLTHSEETKKKIGIANTGKNNGMYGTHHSEDHKKYMSERMSGENHPMYGKSHTEETKLKISQSRKGKYTGEKAYWYGKTIPEEARKKMSEAKKGKETNRGKAVYCPELDKQWQTIAKAKKETGASHISSVVKGNRNYSGKHPETGEPLHWKYVEDYLKENNMLEEEARKSLLFIYE